jgi:hypothetical protein
LENLLVWFGGTTWISGSMDWFFSTFEKKKCVVTSFIWHPWRCGIFSRYNLMQYKQTLARVTSDCYAGFVLPRAPTWTHVCFILVFLPRWTVWSVMFCLLFLIRLNKSYSTYFSECT